jgi:hypothetical protein
VSGYCITDKTALHHAQDKNRESIVRSLQRAGASGECNGEIHVITIIDCKLHGNKLKVYVLM